MEVAECTAQARRELADVNIRTILDPLKWRKLAFFCLIKPSRDIVPVRALYSDSGNTNIGLNPLIAFGGCNAALLTIAHFFAQLTSASGSQEERKRIRLRLFRRRLENYIFGGLFRRYPPSSFQEVS
jgi:hypothetical protein